MLIGLKNNMYAILSSNSLNVLSLKSDSSKSFQEYGSRRNDYGSLYYFFFHSAKSFIAVNKNNETSSHVAFFFSNYVLSVNLPNI